MTDDRLSGAADADLADVEAVRPDRRADRPLTGGRIGTWGHPLTVRLTHWLNVLAMTILVMSGINILMAHPHLYWGIDSTFDSPWMSVPSLSKASPTSPAARAAIGKTAAIPGTPVSEASP